MPEIAEWENQRFEDMPLIGWERMGIKMIDYKKLLQRQYFINGLHLHLSCRYDQAKIYYTKSLVNSGKISTNQMRLRALHNIAIILRLEGNSKIRKVEKKVSFSTLTEHMPSKLLTTDKNKGSASLDFYLSQHFIRRRSTLLIVDSHFDSTFFINSAINYINGKFEELDDDDYFGLISLGSNTTDMVLELKKLNKEAKLDYLRNKLKK